MKTTVLIIISLCFVNCFSVTTATNATLKNSKIYVSNQFLLDEYQSKARIYVQVRSDRSIPIIGVSVEIKADNCRMDDLGITDENGIAEMLISCKNPGSYELFIYAKNYQFNFLLEEHPIIYVVDKIGSTTVKAGITNSVQLFLHDKRSLFSPPYSGQVVFRSSDPLATLPHSLNISAEQLGYVVIQNELIWRTPGSHTLWVEDALTKKIIYETTFQVAYGDVTTLELRVNKLTGMRVDEPFDLVVRAIDTVGNTVEDYQDIVRFYTSDKLALIPFDAAFKVENRGIRVLSDIVLRSSGEQYLIARNNQGDISGRILFPLIQPGDIKRIYLKQSSRPAALKQWLVGIGLEDAFGNPVLISSQRVILRTSDPNAIVPPPFLFSADINSNVQHVPLSFFKAGSHWIAAELQSNQNTVEPFLLDVDVSAGNLSYFKSNTSTEYALAGVPQEFSILPYDNAGNFIDAYQGIISFSTTDQDALVPPLKIYTGQTQDTWDFFVTFQHAGVQQLFIQDEGSRINFSMEIEVEANIAHGLIFRNTPEQIIAGVAHEYTIVAIDIYGNQINDFQGEVSVECSDNACQGSGRKQFSMQADGTMAIVSPFSFPYSGAKQLNAEVIGLSLMQAVVHSIAVAPAEPAQLMFSTQPTDLKACTTAETIQVVAQDAYGNVIDSNTISIQLYLHSKIGLKDIYLQGDTRQLTINGVATFSNIRFESNNERIALIAKSSGLQSAVSNFFEVLRIRPIVSIDRFGPHEKGLFFDYTVQSYCPVELNFSFDNTLYKAHMSADTAMALPRHPIASGIYHETFVWDVKKDLPNTNKTSTFIIRATYDGLSHEATQAIQINTMPTYQWNDLSVQTTNCLEKADLNQDGIQDIIGCQGNIVYALYQDKDGGHRYQQLFVVASVQEIQQVKAIDMNRDQVLDILVVDKLGSFLYPFTFVGPDAYTPSPPIGMSPDIVDLVFLDANTDGKEDLLWISDSTNARLYTMLASQSGLFEPATSILLSGIVKQLDFGHFNRDALPDLALLRDNVIHILLASSSGYSAPVVLTFPQPVNAFVVGMLDRNGYADIVATGQQEMYLYVNKSEIPVNSPSFVHAIDAGVTSVFLTDTNQDRKTDIALIRNGASHGVDVWLQPQDRIFTQAASHTIYAGSIRQLAFLSNMKSKLLDIVVIKNNGSLEKGKCLMHPSSEEVKLDNTYVQDANMINHTLLADIDEDGFIDIVYTTLDEVVLVRGSGQANRPFLPASYRHYIGSVSALVARDINGDNHLDLILSSHVLSRLVLMYGDGKGGFAAYYTDRLGEYIQDVKIADMNQDGYLDIVCLDMFLGKISIFINNSPGYFLTPTQSISVGPGALAIDIGDFNNDDLNDIVVVNPLYGNLSVVQQNSYLSFAINDSHKNIYANVITNDMDRDGYIDLVLIDQANRELYISYGDGSGIFPNSQNIHVNTGNIYFNLGLADVDDNGTLDIIGGPAVTFHGGSNRSFSVINIAEAGYGTRNGLAADLNNDNITDLVGTTNNSIFSRIRRSRDELSMQGMETNRRLINHQNPDPISIASRCPIPSRQSTRHKLIDIDKNGFDDFVCNSSGRLSFNPADPNNYASIYIAFLDGVSVLSEIRLISAVLSRGDGFAIGDVNQDGIHDFVMYDAPTARILFWLSTGAFNWVEQSIITIPSFLNLQLADINHDNKTDMLIGTSNSIQVAYGLGAGAFSVWENITGNFPSAIVDFQLNDFNNDNNQDICFLSGNRLVVTFLDALGKPSLVFPLATISNSASSSFDQIDINSDGFLDVVYGSSNGRNLYVVANNKSGGFESPIALLTDSHSVLSLGVFDVGGDGLQDIVVRANFFKNTWTTNHVLIINENNTQFDPVENHRRQPYANDATFSWSDVSDNGVDDLIVNYSWGSELFTL